MKKIIVLAVLAMTTPAFANALTQGDQLGTSVAEVSAKLSSLGYDVRKSEMEHGKIEVYVVKGNARREIYVDPTTGKVTRIKVK